MVSVESCGSPAVLVQYAVPQVDPLTFFGLIPTISFATEHYLGTLLPPTQTAEAEGGVEIPSLYPGSLRYP